MVTLPQRALLVQISRQSKIVAKASVSISRFLYSAHGACGTMLPMKNITKTITVLLGLLLTGCGPLTPNLVYLTPTPSTLPEAQSQSVEASAVLVQRPRPGPTATFLGPVVGDDYTPPPTATPRATTTPPPTAVPTDGPSAVPTERPSPTGTRMPTFDLSDVGIQAVEFVSLDEWNRTVQRVDEDLQMGWIKIQVSWKDIQPNGSGEISEAFRRLEIYVEQAGQVKGLNVLISVAKAPAWSRSNPTEDGPPDDPQELANFISLMLQEFGNGVAAVEVWNEPNLAREWGGRTISGNDYMRYFGPAYNAVRAYSPTMPVITAGLAPTGDSPFSVDDRTYLQQMYNAGLANYTDIGLGVHPYGWGNPPDSRCCDLSEERGWDDRPQFFFMDTIQDYRDIMVSRGHGNVQMWLTEFGWSTWEGLPGDPAELWVTYNSKWDQANYTMRALQIGFNTDYIGPMFLWNLDFAQPILIEQRDERIGYSIVLPEGNPQERPLYWMLYDAVRPERDLEGFD